MGGNFTPPPSKRTPKKPTQIRVNIIYYNYGVAFASFSKISVFSFLLESVT